MMILVFRDIMILIWVGVPIVQVLPKIAVLLQDKAINDFVYAITN